MRTCCHPLLAWLYSVVHICGVSYDSILSTCYLPMHTAYMPTSFYLTWPYLCISAMNHTCKLPIHDSHVCLLPGRTFLICIYACLWYTVDHDYGICSTCLHKHIRVLLNHALLDRIHSCTIGPSVCMPCRTPSVYIICSICFIATRICAWLYSLELWNCLCLCDLCP